MNHNKRIATEHSSGADPTITSLLRSTYSAPSSDSYWKSLEQRVMTHIHDAAPVAWYSVFSEWRQAGLVAATIALLLGGATIVREQQISQNAREIAAGAAYYTIFEDPAADIAVAFTVPVSEKEPVEAAERYLDTFYP